ncbi:N-terminal nucleophile aminohydrolase [Peniophora sp. CONT]|nr:N-terminal nucleophile aminohydrolase [Peniophora sp. CONT]
MSVPKRTADGTLGNEPPVKRSKEKQQSDLFKFFSSSDAAATASTSLPTRYVPGPFIPVSLPFRPKPYKPGDGTGVGRDSADTTVNEPMIITPEMLARARLPPPGPFVPASLPFLPVSGSLNTHDNQLSGALRPPANRHDTIPLLETGKVPGQTTLPFQAKAERKVSVKMEPDDEPVLPSLPLLQLTTAPASSSQARTTMGTVKLEPEDAEPALLPVPDAGPAAIAKPALVTPKIEPIDSTTSATQQVSFYVIAAHAGAGVHPTELDSATKASLRASLASPPHTNALSAVCTALAALEAAPQLNAGVGSNLTLDGRVECDASLMCGETGAFGAVGALKGVPRPSDAARAVLEHSQQGDMLGRVPPVLLVGEGAHKLAMEHGVEECSEEAMISEGAKKDWGYWKERWEESLRKGSEGEGGREVSDALAARQDTVGAVACGFGDIPSLAAGVSSGGLLLKSPGRIGEAAIYGAGIWADERVAISVSGQGELIIKSALARTIAEAIEDGGEDVDVLDILQKVLVDRFYRRWRMRGEARPDAGVLILHKEIGEDGQPRGRLYCAFTAPSMAIAYATSTQPKPKALVLRNNGHMHGDPDKPPLYITQLPT